MPASDLSESLLLACTNLVKSILLTICENDGCIVESMKICIFLLSNAPARIAPCQSIMSIKSLQTILKKGPSNITFLLLNNTIQLILLLLRFSFIDAITEYSFWDILLLDVVQVISKCNNNISCVGGLKLARELVCKLKKLVPASPSLLKAFKKAFEISCEIFTSTKDNHNMVKVFEGAIGLLEASSSATWFLLSVEKKEKLKEILIETMMMIKGEEFRALISTILALSFEETWIKYKASAAEIIIKADNDDGSPLSFNCKLTRKMFQIANITFTPKPHLHDLENPSNILSNSPDSLNPSEVCKISPLGSTSKLDIIHSIIEAIEKVDFRVKLDFFPLIDLNVFLSTIHNYDYILSGLKLAVLLYRRSTSKLVLTEEIVLNFFKLSQNPQVFTAALKNSSKIRPFWRSLACLILCSSSALISLEVLVKEDLIEKLLLISPLEVCDLLLALELSLIYIKKAEFGSFLLQLLQFPSKCNNGDVTAFGAEAIAVFLSNNNDKDTIAGIAWQWLYSLYFPHFQFIAPDGSIIPFEFQRFHSRKCSATIQINLEKLKDSPLENIKRAENSIVSENINNANSSIHLKELVDSSDIVQELIKRCSIEKDRILLESISGKDLLSITKKSDILFMEEKDIVYTTIVKKGLLSSLLCNGQFSSILDYFLMLYETQNKNSKLIASIIEIWLLSNILTGQFENTRNEDDIQLAIEARDWLKIQSSSSAFFQHPHSLNAFLEMNSIENFIYGLTEKEKGSDCLSWKSYSKKSLFFRFVGCRILSMYPSERWVEVLRRSFFYFFSFGPEHFSRNKSEYILGKKISLLPIDFFLPLGYFPLNEMYGDALFLCEPFLYPEHISTLLESISFCQRQFGVLLALMLHTTSLGMLLEDQPGLGGIKTLGSYLRKAFAKEKENLAIFILPNIKVVIAVLIIATETHFLFRFFGPNDNSDNRTERECNEKENEIWEKALGRSLDQLARSVGLCIGGDLFTSTRQCWEVLWLLLLGCRHSYLATFFLVFTPEHFSVPILEPFRNKLKVSYTDTIKDSSFLRLSINCQRSHFLYSTQIQPFLLNRFYKLASGFSGFTLPQLLIDIVLQLLGCGSDQYAILSTLFMSNPFICTPLNIVLAIFVVCVSRLYIKAVFSIEPLVKETQLALSSLLTHHLAKEKELKRYLACFRLSSGYVNNDDKDVHVESSYIDCPNFKWLGSVVQAAIDIQPSLTYLRHIFASITLVDIAGDIANDFCNDYIVSVSEGDISVPSPLEMIMESLIRTVPGVVSQCLIDVSIGTHLQQVPERLLLIIGKILLSFLVRADWYSKVKDDPQFGSLLNTTLIFPRTSMGWTAVEYLFVLLINREFKQVASIPKTKCSCDILCDSGHYCEDNYKKLDKDLSFASHLAEECVLMELPELLGNDILPGHLNLKRWKRREPPAHLLPSVWKISTKMDNEMKTSLPVPTTKLYTNSIFGSTEFSSNSIGLMDTDTSIASFSLSHLLEDARWAWTHGHITWAMALLHDGLFPIDQKSATIDSIGQLENNIFFGNMSPMLRKSVNALGPLKGPGSLIIAPTPTPLTSPTFSTLKGTVLEALTRIEAMLTLAAWNTEARAAGPQIINGLYLHAETEWKQQFYGLTISGCKSTGLDQTILVGSYPNKSMKNGLNSREFEEQARMVTLGHELYASWGIWADLVSGTTVASTIITFWQKTAIRAYALALGLVRRVDMSTNRKDSCVSDTLGCAGTNSNHEIPISHEESSNSHYSTSNNVPSTSSLLLTLKVAHMWFKAPAVLDMLLCEWFSPSIVSPIVWLPLVHQLAARLGSITNEDESKNKALIQIYSLLVKRYPFVAIYPLFYVAQDENLARKIGSTSKMPIPMIKKRCLDIKSNGEETINASSVDTPVERLVAILAATAETTGPLRAAWLLVEASVELCVRTVACNSDDNCDQNKSSRIRENKNRKPFILDSSWKIVRINSNGGLDAPVLTSKGCDNSDCSEYCQHLAGGFFVAGWAESGQILNGINVPKALVCYARNGIKYEQLFKARDDLRQDALVLQVMQCGLNSHRKAYLNNHWKTYPVIPLKKFCGVIGMVEGCISLGDWLHDAHNGRHRGSISSTDAISMAAAITVSPNESQEERYHHKLAVYKKITEKFPPVFRWFFWEQSIDKGVEGWLRLRMAYSESVGITSLIGWVVGLGDRHPQNILISLSTGALIHVDLNLIFDNGKFLKVPERVPFRLTPEIRDGLLRTWVKYSCHDNYKKKPLNYDSKQAIHGYNEYVGGGELNNFGDKKPVPSCLASSMMSLGIFGRAGERTLMELQSKTDLICMLFEAFKHDPLYGQWRSSPNEADRALNGIRAKLSSSSLLCASAQVNTLVYEAIDEQALASMYHGWQAWM